MDDIFSDIKKTRELLRFLIDRIELVSVPYDSNKH
jgi:hypothetical protein